MQTKAKANSTITHSMQDGKIEFRVLNAGSFSFDPDKVSAENRARAMIHGFVQRISDGGALSRKDLDDMTPFVATFGAKGVAWTKITAAGWQSPIAKFLSETEKKEIERVAGSEVGDVILFSADIAKIVYDALGNLRLYLAEKLGLIPEKE